jgi:drug/metabolite transporter (DMT)-like permease
VVHRTLRAIAIMIAAVAVFSFMDMTLNLLAAHYPPMQVAVLRGAASLPFTLLPVLISGRLRDLRPHRWPMHLLRGALTVVVLGGFIYAVKVLSLANAYSVFLSAPLIVAALSVLLLKERLPWGNWLAILAGLGGVLTMLRPDASGWASLGALAALIGASAYALSGIRVARAALCARAVRRRHRDRERTVPRVARAPRRQASGVATLMTVGAATGHNGHPVVDSWKMSLANKRNSS